MTEMQRAFAVAYVKNGHNATQASITAGASPRSARQIGSKWLTSHDIKAYINELEAEATAKAQAQAKEAMLTPERAILILTEIASNTNNRPADRTSALKVYLDHFGAQVDKEDSQDTMLERALLRASEVWDDAEQDHPY